jgi:undecaprenyl-phosphate 4-deoxy-4-formamido-L-arabinose transferase
MNSEQASPPPAPRLESSTGRSVEISVVVPVFNEEENLPDLTQRLLKVMDGLERSYEILFTNDGSTDHSFEILSEFHRAHPKKVRIIDFNGNYGQHMAIIAAFERVRGEIVITLDADLQDPPEEIPKLVAKMDEGFNYVGGYRRKRQDSFGRRFGSKLINFVRSKMTDIRMTDQGCMLRAYRRHVIEAICRCGERSTFIPALAYRFAAHRTEVEVEHHERTLGESKYSYYKLIRLNFDLITGFTLVPLQLFTVVGFVVATLSALFVVFLGIRRLVIGPEAEGLFTLFAILFFLISVAIVGIGLIGEYVGRTYQAVQQRPRYILRSIQEDLDE